MINTIVTHCSALPYGTADGIRRHHLSLGWADIGYHFVVGNGRASRGSAYDPELDGIIWLGRDLDGDGDVFDERGAHALGLNATSIGVCLVGLRGHFTARQLRRAAGLHAGIVDRFGLEVEAVIGHCETPHEQSKPIERRKTCPEIDMNAFREDVAAALETIRAARYADKERAA